MFSLSRNNNELIRPLRSLLGIICLAAVTKTDSTVVFAFSSTSTTSRNSYSNPIASRYQGINKHTTKPWVPTTATIGCLCQALVSDVDTISTPTSLIEEEMLLGPEQSLLLELEEPKRRKIWKQLEKATRLTSMSKSKSTGGGFGGGGFGGGGKSKKAGAKRKQKGAEVNNKNEKQAEHSEFDAKQDKSRFGAVIVEQGVARINGRLSQETAASLLEFINGYLEEALTTKVEDMSLEEIYKQQTYFADVREKLNRWDMLLPLEESETVQQALWELLVDDPVLADSIASILGHEAQLYEMGTLISDPGSERQLLHATIHHLSTWIDLYPSTRHSDLGQKVHQKVSGAVRDPF